MASPDNRVWPAQYFNLADIARHQCAKIECTIWAGEIVDPHTVDEYQSLRAASATNEGASLAAKPAARGDADAWNGLQGFGYCRTLKSIQAVAVNNFDGLPGFGSRLFEAAGGDNNYVIGNLRHDIRWQNRKCDCRVL